jgi:hypothetical protein
MQGPVSMTQIDETARRKQKFPDTSQPRQHKNPLLARLHPDIPVAPVEADSAESRVEGALSGISCNRWNIHIRYNLWDGCQWHEALWTMLGKSEDTYMRASKASLERQCLTHHIWCDSKWLAL